MSQENSIENSVVNLPSEARKKGEELNIGRKEAVCVLLTGVAVAFFYTICFNGVEILPLISFSLFCPFAFIALTFVLKYLGCLKNKGALKWAVPIIIVAGFNGIFNLSIFTYGNVLVMHLLFACYIVTAVREQPFDMFCLSSLKMILRTIIGNYFFIFDVFKSLTDKNQSKSDSHLIRKVLLGALLSVPLLFVIISLLVSADMVFGKLLQDIAQSVAASGLINISFILTFIIIWAYTIGYVFQSRRICESANNAPCFNIKADAVICATFLTLLNIVFLLFAVIQVAYLFGGGFMELPEGMIYSQYAREGFFQLLFVTVINFSVIFVFINVLKGVMESKPLRLLFMALCGFTGVLIASSFYRMYLYIEVYGYTTLRLWVITFLVMEVFLIGVTVRKLLNDQFAFVKWFVITVFVFYLAVNVTGSEYFAEQLNLNKFGSIGYSNEDLNYGRKNDEDFSLGNPNPEHWQNWNYLK